MRLGDREFAEAIQELVDIVAVYHDPSATSAVEIEVSGCLNSVLGNQAYQSGVKRVCGLVVADAGLASRQAEKDPAAQLNPPTLVEDVLNSVVSKN